MNLCGVIVGAVGIWILWRFCPKGMNLILTTEQIGCALYVCNLYCWLLLEIDKGRGYLRWLRSSILCNLKGGIQNFDLCLIMARTEA